MTCARTDVAAAALLLASALSIGSTGCRRSQPSAAGETGDAGGAGQTAAAARAEAAAPPPDDLLPSGTSDDLTLRARHLLDAIDHDDARFAADMMFPRDGWTSTRDTPDPSKDWEKHVAAPFRRAVHVLSRDRGELAGAELVSVEIGAATAQAIPRRHGWKRPLWIARKATLTFVLGGRSRRLRIREMVAWRGAWYVTRLR